MLSVVPHTVPARLSIVLWPFSMNHGLGARAIQSAQASFLGLQAGHEQIAISASGCAPLPVMPQGKLGQIRTNGSANDTALHADPTGRQLPMTDLLLGSHLLRQRGTGFGHEQQHLLQAIDRTMRVPNQHEQHPTHLAASASCVPILLATLQ